MKNKRQDAILSIISSQDVETQGQLRQLLRQQGIDTTQATISRDINELRLIKSSAGGRSRYVVLRTRDPEDTQERLRSIFRQSVVSAQAAQNLLVLKTMPGLAGGACEAVDHMQVGGLVGTLAGENTVLAVMQDAECAQEFCRRIQKLLP